MKKVFISNLGLKILSVLVACVIWIFVVNADDPETKKAFSDVAVEIRNSDSFGVDKTFSVEEDTDHVKIWVNARESVLGRLQAKDFKVVADMRNVTLGDAVPYTIECTNSSITKANWECEPASMKIKVEDVVQESFAVEVNNEGSPSDGYVIGTTSILEGDTINISGAESLVNIIHKVTVTIRTHGISSDELLSGNIEVTDRNGTKFTKSQMDKLNFTTSSGVLIKNYLLTVRVGLWQVQRDVKLEVGTSGNPAVGYRVAAIKTTPETVSLAGDEEVMKKLNGVLKLPDMISVQGVSASFTSETINLSDFLKENYKGKLKLEDGAASTISVKVTVERIGTKTIDMPLSEMVIKGRPENMDMVLTPADKLSIEVGALSAELDAISSKNIKAQLDLSNYQEAGRYEVPVQITLPEGYELESEVVMVVNLTQKVQTEDMGESQKTE